MSLTGGNQATWASTSDGRPMGRFDPRGRHDWRGAVVTGGTVGHLLVAGVHQGAREGAGSTRHETGNLKRAAAPWNGRRSDVHDGDRRRPTAANTNPTN